MSPMREQATKKEALSDFSTAVVWTQQHAWYLINAQRIFY